MTEPQSVRTKPTTPRELIHITLPVGMLQCNCTIIGDPVTREALVIDPGDEVTRIMDLLGRHKLTVKAIVSTHAHIDHVGGLSKLHKYTGAPVMMHREDLPLYQAMDVQAAFLGVLPPELTDVHQLLTEGDVLQWGSLASPGDSYARAHSGKRLPVYAAESRQSRAGFAATFCGRHAVCRQHRTNRFVGRVHGSDYGFATRE